jgi:hypothetical protein
MKGLWCGELLTEDGGTLILVTKAGEGLNGYSGLPAYIGRDPDEVKQALTAAKCLDRMEAATGIMVGWMKQRIRICLVSTGLTSEDSQKMVLPYYETVDEAIENAVSRLPVAERRGSVVVITHAGIMLPILPGSVI